MNCIVCGREQPSDLLSTRCMYCAALIFVVSQAKEEVNT